MRETQQCNTRSESCLTNDTQFENCNTIVAADDLSYLLLFMHFVVSSMKHPRYGVMEEHQ